MNSFADTLSEGVQSFGKSFLLAYYLPATILVGFNLYFFAPIWIDINYYLGFVLRGSTVIDVDLLSLLILLLISLLISTLFFGLNDVFIHFYEGRLWWLKYSLLYPFYRFNKKRHKRYHQTLYQLQQKYHEIGAEMVNLKHSSSNQEQEITICQQKLIGLQTQIQQEQDKIESLFPSGLDIPLNPKRILPTKFGNAYAKAEEYAYERYGVDSVLFWPHLRSLMDEKADSLSVRLGQQKTKLDMTLNLSLISGLITLESLLFLIWIPAQFEAMLLSIFILGLILTISFYSASIRAIQLQGEFIKMSFDYYRHLILDAFDLPSPSDLFTEQTVWVRLAAFLRRGNAFYFPAEITPPIKDTSSSSSNKANTDHVPTQQ